MCPFLQILHLIFIFVFANFMAFYAFTVLKLFNSKPFADILVEVNAKKSAQNWLNYSLT